MVVYITEHGDQRARQRLGIPRKAVPRMAARALQQGKRLSDFRASLRCRLEAIISTLHPNGDPRIYGEFVWIYESERLVTLWLLPQEIRRLLT